MRDARRSRHETFKHIGVFRFARLPGQGQVQFAQMDAVDLEIPLAQLIEDERKGLIGIVLRPAAAAEDENIGGHFVVFFDYAATPAGSVSTMGSVSLRSGRTSLPKISASSLWGHPFMMKCRTPAS